MIGRVGLAPVAEEVDAGWVRLDGDPAIARATQQRLGLSVFAPAERRVA
jgi:hypothetical protein